MSAQMQVCRVSGENRGSSGLVVSVLMADLRCVCTKLRLHHYPAGYGGGWTSMRITRLQMQTHTLDSRCYTLRTARCSNTYIYPGRTPGVRLPCASPILLPSQSSTCLSSVLNRPCARLCPVVVPAPACATSSRASSRATRSSRASSRATEQQSEQQRKKERCHGNLISSWASPRQPKTKSGGREI